jgi:hypothetical protein
MLEFLKRLTGRGTKSSSDEPSSESPSWHPNRPPQSPEQKGPNPFSTLQPEGTPTLKKAGLTEEVKDKPAE